MKELNNKKEQSKSTKNQSELWLGYGRVSSWQQVKDWNGLPCQKKRCAEYAKNKGHIMEEFFWDEGVSWGTKERPWLKALFEYITKNKAKSITLVCEDMNRLARDMLVYLSLKLDFERKWVKVLYVNQEIDDSPQGRIVEQMFMMIAQFFREENKERVKCRQKSRLEDGYWCHWNLQGYKRSTNKKWGKRLLLDEPNCYIIKEVLEKFANYEFDTITSAGFSLNSRGIKVGCLVDWKFYSTGAITRMLCNVAYAWYVNVPSLGINMVKAKHQALISMETHKKILKRVEEIRIKRWFIQAKMEVSGNRIDRSEDFPLRGALYFEWTHYMLSGTWVKGRRGKLYAYYIFPRLSKMKWKTILRENLHEQFENLLERIQPKEELLTKFQEIIRQKIEERDNNRNLLVASHKDELKSIENKITRYTERIWKTEDDYLISNYESELKKLYQEKDELLSKIEDEKKPLQTTKRIDYELIRNALQIRRNWSLDDKKRLIKNIFPEWIPVNEKQRIQTPQLSLVYTILEAWKVDECRMVELIRQYLNLLH